MCCGKKLFIAWHLPEGLVFARVLRMAALYLSQGRAILLPTAHYQCQEHLCKVVMQTCHLWEARSGRTECVSSVICVLKGVSFQPARRRQDEERKVLGILESSHISAKTVSWTETFCWTLGNLERGMLSLSIKSPSELQRNFRSWKVSWALWAS